MKHDPAYALLHATPYLELFGHVSTAYYLVDAAVNANEHLKSIVRQAGASTPQTRAAAYLSEQRGFVLPSSDRFGELFCKQCSSPGESTGGRRSERRSIGS